MCCLSTKLPCVLKDAFCTAVVLFQLAANFDIFPCKLADISDFFQIIRKNDNRKRTHPIVFAEIKIVHAPIAGLNAENFPNHTLGLAKMIPGLGEGKAGGWGKCRNRYGEEREYLASAAHTGSLVCGLHIPAPFKKNMDLR